MSDMRDQLDKYIAQEQTADLPEAPTTPVNTEAFIAENSQSGFNRRVAETE